MIRLLALLATLAAAAAAQPGPATVTLTYLGQATFVMSTSTGLKALIDPVAQGMYKNAPVDGVDEFLNVLDSGTKVVQEGRAVTLTVGKLPAARTVMVMKAE